MYVCMFVCLYVCTYVRTYVCMYVYICVCVCMGIYIYIYHLHIYINNYLYIILYSNRLCSVILYYIILYYIILYIYIILYYIILYYIILYYISIYYIILQYILLLYNIIDRYLYIYTHVYIQIGLPGGRVKNFAAWLQLTAGERLSATEGDWLRLTSADFGFQMIVRIHIIYTIYCLHYMIWSYIYIVYITWYYILNVYIDVQYIHGVIYIIIICLWINTYTYHFWGDDHPFTSYFDVNYRGTRFWHTAIYHLVI